jgi:hypothetical protein
LLVCVVVVLLQKVYVISVSVWVSKTDGIVDVAMLEFCIRQS